MFLLLYYHLSAFTLWLGEKQGTSSPKCSFWKTWPPRLTWSNIWKTRPVKQKNKSSNSSIYLFIYLFILLSDFWLINVFNYYSAGTDHLACCRRLVELPSRSVWPRSSSGTSVRTACPRFASGETSDLRACTADLCATRS